jgi:hypothetical protein
VSSLGVFLFHYRCQTTDSTLFHLCPLSLTRESHKIITNLHSIPWSWFVLQLQHLQFEAWSTSKVFNSASLWIPSIPMQRSFLFLKPWWKTQSLLDWEEWLFSLLSPWFLIESFNQNLHLAPSTQRSMLIDFPRPMNNLQELWKCFQRLRESFEKRVFWEWKCFVNSENCILKNLE